MSDFNLEFFLHLLLLRLILNIIKHIINVKQQTKLNNDFRGHFTFTNTFMGNLLYLYSSYLLFVTTITTAGCVKKVAKCKNFQIVKVEWENIYLLQWISISRRRISNFCSSSSGPWIITNCYLPDYLSFYLPDYVFCYITRFFLEDFEIFEL